MVFSKNKEILIDLLKAITKYEIKDLTILSKDFTLDKYKKDGKLGVLDIRTELEDGTNIDIEMQIGDEKNIIERLLFYQSGMYYQSIKSGQKYNKAKKAVVIGILNFNLFSDNYNYFSETNYYIQKVDKNGIIHEIESLNDRLKIFLIELPKFKEVEHNLDNRLEQWLTVISSDNVKEMGVVMEKNTKIQTAMKEVEKLSADEDLLEMIEAEEERLRRYNTAMETSHEEGERQGILKVAKKLLKTSELNISKVSEITQLTEEEIMNLKNELENENR